MGRVSDPCGGDRRPATVAGGGERQDLYVTPKWSSFSNAARRRKSKLISDISRYGILIAMIPYLESATITVTRIFLLKI